MENIQIPISELPFSVSALEEQYGAIYSAELMCPGVYFIVSEPCKKRPACTSEFILVTGDSPAISPIARTYGTPVPTAPEVLLFDYEDYFNKGRHVVEYEVHKYLVEQGCAQPEISLIQDRARGMEVCPEYFGEFPIPTETPWGGSLRCDRLWNGLYWLETERVGWVLAVAYPLCDDLFDETKALAELMEYDRENGIDHTCGYRFYTYEMSCLPLFEMWLCADRTWGGKINGPALKNAILELFPDYIKREAYHDPALPEGGRILPTPGAGTEFYRFR